MRTGSDGMNWIGWVLLVQRTEGEGRRGLAGLQSASVWSWELFDFILDNSRILL